MYEPFKILSLSHFLVVALCILLIVYLPRLFLGVDKQAEMRLRLTLVFLILSFQVFDFYKVVYLFGEPWKTALPFHLCDFSALSIAAYLLTNKKYFFNFAFFWGISGAGMAILTPNAVLGFPSVDYLANQYGHTLILLSISTSMIVLEQRPYLRDIFTTFGFTSLLLPPLYALNYFLQTPANYWYLLEKPIGNNIMTPLPEAPFHMLYLYPIAFVFLLLVYAPYYVLDRRQQ
jgi:hypothetical integral membrane protein (TIGR02206 family)